MAFFVTGGVPGYSVTVDGAEVIPASPVGLTLDDTDYSQGLTITAVSAPRQVRIDYELPSGKVARVAKTMTEREISAVNADGLPVTFVLRADEGAAAFQYRFPDRGDGLTHTVTSEATGFSVYVPADGGQQFTQGYPTSTEDYQELYISRTSHVIPQLGTATPDAVGASYPILLRAAAKNGSQWWVFASETGADGTYPGCHLQQPALNTAGTQAAYTIAFPLDSEFGGVGQGAPLVSGAWHTPWRYVAVSRDLTQLANTTLTTDLALPSQVADTSWIRYGGMSWSWLTDSSGPESLEVNLGFMALAQQMGWPYCLLDGGWPGMTDADGNPVSLEQVTAAAAGYGLRLFLWYDGTQPDLSDPVQRRQLFGQLQQLGIAGVKADEWKSDKQAVLATQYEVLQDAADYQLLVILDDCSIPRGWDRTFPHLVSAEGGMSSEYTKDVGYPDQLPEQHTIAMITRNTTGVFEYCPVLFDTTNTGNALSPRRSSDAQELATAVGYYSAVTVFSDNPADYLAQPEAVQKFLATVPQTWDETRILAADPASHVVIARRKGATWYIAGINGKTLTIAPTYDVTSADYFPPTGQPIPMTVSLADLGIRGSASVQLFADTSATDQTLAITTMRSRQFTVQTAPFGGFLAIV